MSEQSTLLSVARLPGNSLCVQCLTSPSSYLVPSFGVFLCQQCANLLASRVPGVIAKSLTLDLFSDSEVETAKRGGNSAFRDYFSALNQSDFVGKFAGGRADNYQRMLQEDVDGIKQGEDHEENTVSERVTNSINRVFSWLDSKFSPLVESVNSKVSNSGAGKKLSTLIDSTLTVLDEKVTVHIVNDSGFLHPVKERLDSISKVFQAEEVPMRVSAVEEPLEEIHTEGPLREDAEALDS